MHPPQFPLQPRHPPQAASSRLRASLGQASAQAPQAAVYGLCVADPCAWIAADAVLCIPFIKNIMRENYDYLYGSGQKLIDQ